MQDDITQAFKTLSMNGSKELSREALVEALASYGEAMSEDELAECLYILTGLESNIFKELLPDTITAKSFAEDILGFEDQLV